MKKLYALVLFVLMIHTMMAQQSSPVEMKYRRSSLNMILLESNAYPKKETVMNSWSNYPFPSKYNKHEIGLNSINVESIELSDLDLLDCGFLMDTLRTPMELIKASAALKNLKYLTPDSTVAVVLPSEKEVFQAKIDKIIKEKQIAKQLVAKWFSRNSEGVFNSDLIAERGLFAASASDVASAKAAELGEGVLKQAGFELIGNTFTTFTKIEFFENEPVARVARDIAKAELVKKMAGKPQVLVDKSMELIDKAYDKAKDGYTLVSKTWLYQLNWNDTIAAKFYEIWDKPQEFDKADFFELKFVGVNYNTSTVLLSTGGKTLDQMIDIAFVRNIDNTFSKLQKEYDVFKPKVPILTIDPITADIGMKEGLSGGEKFEVLELNIDPKTGKSEYKVVGKVSVDKKKVWDNRYNLSDNKEEGNVVDENGQQVLVLKATTFKGGGRNIYPGMLLNQVK